MSIILPWTVLWQDSTHNYQKIVSTNSEPTITDSHEIGSNTTNPSSRSVLDQSYPSDLLETPQNIHDTSLNVLESLPLLFSDDQFETKQQQLDLTQHCEQQTNHRVLLKLSKKQIVLGLMLCHILGLATGKMIFGFCHGVDAG
jgi:hypothetical protein